MNKHLALAATLVLSLLFANQASAHCDSMDGPVIRDARIALETRDATPVLKWVTKAQEPGIQEAFRRTLAVRSLGEDARQLADQSFFETLVRIHRAGEGEAFTGLKPAGSVDPGIAAADKALDSGSGPELAAQMSAEVKEGILKRFETAQDRKKHAGDSVDAGRKYVEAYVDYIHFVETVHQLAEHGAPHRHQSEAPHEEE